MYPQTVLLYVHIRVKDISKYRVRILHSNFQRWKKEQVVLHSASQRCQGLPYPLTEHNLHFLVATTKKSLSADKSPFSHQAIDLFW